MNKGFINQEYWIMSIKPLLISMVCKQCMYPLIGLKDTPEIVNQWFSTIQMLKTSFRSFFKKSNPKEQQYCLTKVQMAVGSKLPFQSLLCQVRVTFCQFNMTGNIKTNQTSDMNLSLVPFVWHKHSSLCQMYANTSYIMMIYYNI